MCPYLPAAILLQSPQQHVELLTTQNTGISKTTIMKYTVFNLLNSSD